MKRYVVRRLLMAIPLLLAISFVCFLFINLIPSNPAEVALYLHFIARGLPAQKAVDFLKQAVHFPVSGLILPEHHKGQGAALRNRENIFLVHCAVLRSYGRAGKDNERNGVGTVAGWLTDSVQYIPVDKDAVTRL